MNNSKGFLGLTVEGRIIHDRADQRPIEELAPLFRAVLDDSFIAEFGWEQYTRHSVPSGFAATSIWVRTINDDESWSRAELELANHPTLPGPARDTYERCTALDGAIAGGRFRDVLYAAFGDHAQVAVTRRGIEVAQYFPRD